MGDGPSVAEVGKTKSAKGRCCRFRLSLYVNVTYSGGMEAQKAVAEASSATTEKRPEAKTHRWTLRVTPTQDSIVRQVLAASGMSLNDYVVNCAIASATADLADRHLFLLEPGEWDELQEIVNRPATPKPKIAKLLETPSVLEAE